MKSIILTLLFSVFLLSLSAQDFEIVSVESLPADMSAREETKTDHNDRQCALLRIATQNIAPEQREGFNFKLDYGSEVVERAMRNGEIWLWVSPGLKYIRIMHSDWGQYELYMPDHITRVEALHTYKITIRGIINSPQPNISYSFQELFVLTDEKTGMQGAVDINGKLVIPYKYESLSNLEMMKSHFLFVKNSRMGILDNKGKVCVSNLYDALLPDEDNNVIIAYKNEKLGLIDFSEKILLPFVYDFIDEHKGDLVLVGKADYEKEVIKFGVINLKERREVIPCQYEAIILGSTIYEQNHCADPLFIENKSQSPLIAIKKNGKVGFANENGQIVIPCKYDGIDLLDHIAEESSEQDYYTVEDNYNAYIFQDGKSIFIKNGKVGLIDENGKEIVPAIWSSIRNYPSNKITHHYMSGSSFYIHQPKKCTYDYATAVMEGKGSVLLDKNGKVCTDYYEDIWEDEGFVVYKENGKYGLLNINTKGKITEAFYDDLYCASEGYIIYKQDEKYGYLDRQGDKKFFNYYNYNYLCDDVSPFKNGYATVKKDDKYGYVSRRGDYIFSKYDYATPFNEDGLAVVKKEGKYGVINVKEKTIVPFNYDDIDVDEKNKWFVVCVGGWYRWSEESKLGIVDFVGNEIIEPKYSNEQLEIEIAKYLKDAERSNVTTE